MSIKQMFGKYIPQRHFQTRKAGCFIYVLKKVQRLIFGRFFKSKKKVNLICNHVKTLVLAFELKRIKYEYENSFHRGK